MPTIFYFSSARNAVKAAPAVKKKERERVRKRRNIPKQKIARECARWRMKKFPEDNRNFSARRTRREHACRVCENARGKIRSGQSSVCANQSEIHLSKFDSEFSENHAENPNKASKLETHNRNTVLLSVNVP